MKKKIAALVLLMLAVSCMGTAARKEALIPAMLLTWQSSIAESVELGGGDPGPMTEALKSGDPKKVLEIDWVSLRQDALNGVRKLMANGQIGFNVMNIMHAEIAMFDRAMQALAGKAKLVRGTRFGVKTGDFITYRNNYPRGRYATR